MNPLTLRAFDPASDFEAAAELLRGAVRLYERMDFVRFHAGVTYRKSLEL